MAPLRDERKLVLTTPTEETVDGLGAAALAVQRGRLGPDARISLPGGELRIQWAGEGQPVVMSGPSAFVFEGEWNA